MNALETVVIKIRNMLHEVASYSPESCDYICEAQELLKADMQSYAAFMGYLGSVSDELFRQSYDFQDDKLLHISAVLAEFAVEADAIMVEELNRG